MILFFFFKKKRCVSIFKLNKNTSHFLHTKLNQIINTEIHITQENKIDDRKEKKIKNEQNEMKNK